MAAPAEAGVVTIDSLRREEVDEAAALLARSFVDEPLHAYLLHDLSPDRRVRVMTPFFRTSLRVFLAGGVIHAARVDGRLAGVGIRSPPGVYPPRDWRGIGARARLFAAFVRVVLQAPRYRATRAIARTSDSLTPTDPHWGLQWIGTEPSFQGRGISGRLTDEVLGLCDEQGVGCYFGTFTPVVRSYCERRGFSLLGEIRPLPGGPPCWLMWREPRAAITA